MRTTFTTFALAALALADPLPQGVTSAIAPSGTPPAECSENYNGVFQIAPVDSASKRSLGKVRPPFPFPPTNQPPPQLRSANTLRFAPPATRPRKHRPPRHHPKKRHPPRPRRPHRLRRLQLAIPIRRPSSGGSDLHRRLLDLREREFDDWQRCYVV